jgi:zinc protease
MNDRRQAAALALGLALAAGSAGVAAAAPPLPKVKEDSAIRLVTLPSASSPLVSIRLMFDAGSMYDPAGKEGLAALTALMVGQSGTRKRSYRELTEALYPMAATIGTNTDREVTVFAGTVDRETLADYTALLAEAVLTPGFAAADFTRNKEQLLGALAALKSGSDELLGLEALQDVVFAGHPYGHPPEGTVTGLQSLTLDDVKRFYHLHYTRAALMLGVAGGYPKAYVGELERALSALPPGVPGRKPLPPPPPTQGRRLTLIQKQTGAVGIHFGYALPVNRTSPDYFPLLVANSYLGEHRTFFGRLMDQLRKERGLNYGDYSYVEFWPNPPSTDSPAPNVARREQYFSVWIRPVVPGDAQFALRAGLYEVERLRDQGMKKEDFELARDFLLHHSKLWVQTLSDRLGFHMDSAWYGTPYFIDELEARLKKMTVDDVNRAAKKYLQTENYQAVLITADAAKLKEALQSDQPSPKKYNSPVKPEVLETDKTIQALPVKPTVIAVVPVEEVFQK